MEVSVKDEILRPRYSAITALLFVAIILLSACADGSDIVGPTPTRVTLYDPQDFAVATIPDQASTPVPADTPVVEALPEQPPLTTPAPVETPVVEPTPVVEQAETPVAETPLIIGQAAVPVVEDTPVVETPITVAPVETPLMMATPTAEAPLIVGQAAIPVAEETPVMSATPVLVEVVTPVVEETPQTPLIIGQATVPIVEATPVVETPLATAPAAAPVPIETPVVDPTPQPELQPVPPAAAPGVARGLVEASTLRGRTITNIVVDLGTRQVLFATIRYGALLRLADRRVPVPPEYIHWDAQERRLVLTLPEGTIANMRSHPNRWPDLAGPQWIEDVHESWQAIEPNRFLHPPIAAVKVDTVLGERVVGADGEELATVSELLLDLEANQIAYVVLRMSGGFLGLGREYRAVPMELFELQAIDQRERQVVLRLNVQESMLRDAPVYDADLLRNGDATWEFENRRYWENAPRHQQTARY
jgi:sporulation protein YlmC with PRC-barrel domain